MAAFDPKGWDWWQAALAAVEAGNAGLIGSDALPIYEDQPMTGFYRSRTFKNGPFIAVRIWYTPSGDLKGAKNEHLFERDQVVGLWRYCAPNPISFERYNDFLGTPMEGREPESPQGVWFDEVVVESGGKTMSSHVEEPKAVAAPAKAKKAPRRKDPATVEPEQPKPAPVEAQVEPEAEAQVEAQVEVDEWGDPIPVLKTPPVERYWHNASTRRLFTSEKDYSTDPSVEEISQHQYETWIAQRAAEKQEVAEAVAARAAPKSQPEPAEAEPANDRAVIGDNSGDGSAKSQFEQLVEDADEWIRTIARMSKAGTPKTKAEADKLADAKTKLGDLWKAIEAMRKAEKEPFDEGAKAVQAKFKPVLTKIEIAGDKAVATLKPYLDEQNRIEQERVAAENKRRRDEAERDRLAAIEAAKEAGDDPAEVEVPVVREEKARNVGVGNRKTVSAVARPVAVVVDAEKAMAFMAAQKPLHPEFDALLRKIGHRMMSLGIAVPGMKMGVEGSVR